MSKVIRSVVLKNVEFWNGKTFEHRDAVYLGNSGNFLSPEIAKQTNFDAEIDEYIGKMFETEQKKLKVTKYINEQFIANADFRAAILPDAIDMIFDNEESKEEIVTTIVDFVINDEEALADMTEIAIEDLVEDGYKLLARRILDTVE